MKAAGRMALVLWLVIAVVATPSPTSGSKLSAYPSAETGARGQSDAADGITTLIRSVWHITDVHFGIALAASSFLSFFFFFFFFFPLLGSHISRAHPVSR